MYKTKTNEEIGQYLLARINEKFESQRQFGIACIKLQEDIPEDVQVNEDKIQNMANRISQILKGNKEIQLYDFPIFTELLDVSCEEILSAGECAAPTAKHLTNYSVAFSRDAAVWESYVNREDMLMLNLDEYGKSVIEYALDFKNFEFLKYLIANKYLWFVDAAVNPKDYFKRYAGTTFGAGTKIERRLPPEHDEMRWHISYRKNERDVECSHPYQRDTLRYELAGNDNLRMRMISLAVEHNEVELLEKLRAREIPSLYLVCFIGYRMPDCDRYYDDRLIKCIANADDKILDYFSEEFEIEDMYGHANTFLFPYMSDLINLLIRKRNTYAEKMLSVSIEHNQNTLKKLKELKEKTTNDRINCFGMSDYTTEHAKKICEDTIAKEIEKLFSFHDNGNIVCYRDASKTVMDGMITNIVHVKEESKDKKINTLIHRLNDLYNEIRDKKFDCV